MFEMAAGLGRAGCADVTELDRDGSDEVLFTGEAHGVDARGGLGD